MNEADMSYWKSSLEDIEECISGIQKGRVTLIGRSAGGRPIYLIEYGKSESGNRTANYSSAIGARDLSAYKNHTKPHICLISGEHGAEWEGIVANLNLIHIFETGKDYQGVRFDELAAWPENSYIAIIPCANPDGRARIPLKTVVGLDRQTFRKWDQGIWNNGQICEWPDCKRVHPIKGYVKFLGGYFNDNGVNLLHDNVFAPMAEETKVLLKTISDMAPDFIGCMHGHAGMGWGHLVPAYRQNEECMEACMKLDDLVNQRMKERDYHFKRRQGDWTECFRKAHMNLHDALHLCSGAMVLTYESDQGIIVKDGDENFVENRHEKIYGKAMTFYEAVMEFMNIGQEE